MSALPISAAASARKQTVRSARWKLGFGIAGVADCIGFQLLEKSIAAYERYRGGFDYRLYCCAVFGQSRFFRPAKPAADYPACSV